MSTYSRSWIRFTILAGSVHDGNSLTVTAGGGRGIGGVVVTERIGGVATVTPSVVPENVGTLDKVEVGGIIPRPRMGGGKFL